MQNDKPKVLCVDDEPGVLDSLSRLLKKDFQVFTATTGDGALNLVKEHKDLAVIVSDYRMPGMNGIDLLKEVRAISPSTARTILSGQIDINELSKAINKAEIHRFFLKPWENDYLNLQIHEAVQTHINLSEKSHFKYLAVTDPVTGLSNHRYFQDRIREVVKECKQASLIFIDVDHFKSFNDRYGHPEGDRLLFSIANLISDEVGTEGSTSRYGGEEFAVVVPNINKDDGFRLAERIRKKIAQTPLKLQSREVHVTVSLGISTFPVDSKKPEEIIEMADKALYLSKGQGRNRTTVSS